MAGIDRPNEDVTSVWPSDFRSRTVSIPSTFRRSYTLTPVHLTLSKGQARPASSTDPWPIQTPRPRCVWLPIQLLGLLRRPPLEFK